MQLVTLYILVQHVSKFFVAISQSSAQTPGSEISSDVLFCAYTLEVVGKACHL